MGKKTDRMYMTMKEWTMDFGGKMKVLGQGSTEFIPLPFYCCSLSMQPFETPVATPDGFVFDIINIMPFLRKHKVSPITGQPLSTTDLSPLHFHKNDKDKFHCPITYKEFTEFSYIVAIKTSGNVYSYDAVEELNLKAKNFRDLLTDEPFTKADILTIQDPKNLERRNLNQFHHVRAGIKNKEEAEDPLKNIRVSESTKKIMRQVNEEHEKKMKEKKEKEKLEWTEEEYDPGQKKTRVNAQSANFTSSSFTSPTVEVESLNVARIVDQKGFVALHTSLGDINLEIHADWVPKTSENFLGLCEKHKMDGTQFFTVKRGEYIQGGDPTNSGFGGDSLWGRPFDDEFSSKLQFTHRGVVAMANNGRKNWNNSQFFITLDRCPQYNLKNSIFGQVVGGMDVLRKIEETPTDEEHRPVEDVTVYGVTVYVNPFRIDKESLAKKKAEEERKKKQEEEDKKRGQWYSNPGGSQMKPVKSGVGKYLSQGPSTATGSLPAASGSKRTMGLPPSRPAKRQSQYGDFSKW